MATRRMFDSAIISGDDFTDMPPSAQVLYFHLMGNADDDGFVGNPRGITRMAGCAESDLTELASSGFIIRFAKVVVITHWHVHNKIRKDAYRPTMFKAERELLTIDDSGVYVLKTEPVQDCDRSCTEPVQDCNESVTEPVEDSLHSIGKVRLGKDSIDINSAEAELGESEGSQESDADTGTGTDGGQNTRFDYGKYADAWNDAAGKNGMTKVTAPKHWNDTRKKALKRLCDKQGADVVLAVIKKAGESAFLGNSGRSWRATFDWFIKPGNFLKVREGNYTDTFEKKGKSHDAPPPDEWFIEQSNEMAAETMREMIQRGANG